MNADCDLVATCSPSPNFGERRGRAIDALILHYTGMVTGEAARTRLLEPASEVSCHYLVWEDGRIEQMVHETDRAWHAGRSYWAGETDMNAVSVGIEIVNGGHDFGRPPYPAAQIEAVTALARDICRRRSITPQRVLGHSDIAPSRKRDPGELFPWERLAASGVGLWIDPQTLDQTALAAADIARSARAVQERFSAYGYLCPVSEVFDDTTHDVVAAFQRHYRPARVDGVADGSTLSTLQALAAL